MDYQKMILVGNVSNDPKVRKTKKGDHNFTTFSVAVNDGRDHTNFFPVVVFGKLGNTIAQHVTKGQQVLVEGSLLMNEKGRCNIIADRIRFGIKPTKPQAKQKTQ